jgi:molybdopterin converting factor small subunit
MAQVTVRYWAALRTEAGMSELAIDATTVAEAFAQIRSGHHAGSRFIRLLTICAVIVDGRPVGRHDYADVVLSEGSVVELLPPFAGGR